MTNPQTQWPNGHKVNACVVSLLLTACMAVSAGAEDVQRFSGRIGTGVMFIDSGNNLNPRGSKKVIENLDSAADPELSVIPLVLPAITYDAGEPGGFKLYLDTDPPIDEAGRFVVTLGGSSPLGKAGIADLATFFAPFDEVWKNPYLVGTERQTSSTSKYGVRLSLNRILGTGLRLNMVALRDDVDDDEIGLLEPTMARDGAVYAIGGNYSLAVSETLEIRPRFSVRRGIYDGDSNSFVKYKAELEARYRWERLMLIPRVAFSFSDYDELNPIFGKTREDTGFDISLMANYMAPFGWVDWSVQVLAGCSRGDSNINFYDTESINLGLFLSYHL